MTAQNNHHHELLHVQAVTDVTYKLKWIILLNSTRWKTSLIIAVSTTTSVCLHAVSLTIYWDGGGKSSVCARHAEKMMVDLNSPITWMSMLIRLFDQHKYVECERYCLKLVSDF